MEDKNLNGAANGAAKANNDYGFNFSILAEKPVETPYDNEGACAELNKDMERNDNLSIKFSKDSDGYSCVWIESRNVAPYKVRLNPEIFSWLMQYLETGKAVCKYNPEPMEPIEADDETYKVDMLKLFVNSGKKIQWTPLFRERNGKLSGTYIARHGKVFFYVNYTDELIDWLREMKQAI